MMDVLLFPPRSTHTYERREVHEHRAPTDESVRLLKDFEEKADAKRVASMQMPGNQFNGVVEVFETCLDDTRHARAVFDVNGTRLTAEAWTPRQADTPALLLKLHEATARKLAAHILVDMTRGLRLP